MAGQWSKIVAYEVDADLTAEGATPVEIPAAPVHHRGHDTAGRRWEAMMKVSGVDQIATVVTLG